MKSPLSRFVVKLALFVLPIGIGFEVLFRLGFSPIVTNSMLFDYKMLQTQKHPIGGVQVLSMGSSIALYQLKSEVIVQNINRSYYNFASWGLQITDMQAILSMLVKEYKPNYVIICATLGEFSGPSNDSYLNYTRTNRFIREDFPEFFYFRNYHSIHQLYLRKRNGFYLDFDPWGGASPPPLPKDSNRDKADERFADFPTAFSAIQYRALDSLTASLREQKIKLIFAGGHR